LNETGGYNLGVGAGALQANSTGGYNVAIGAGALATLGADGAAASRNNTAVGAGALGNATTGSYNIAIGYNAGSSADGVSNNIIIGATALSTSAPAINLGVQGTQTATFVAGIFGAAVTGSPVVVNSLGQLGIAPSSARFKENIQDMGSASEAILALRPVTFRYKPEIDPAGRPQFGLVAEEVAKISPDLVTRDAKGQIFTVRYDAVNAMLLNEFRKQHERLETQKRTIAQLETEVAELVERNRNYEALASRLAALEHGLDSN